MLEADCVLDFTNRNLSVPVDNTMYLVPLNSEFLQISEPITVLENQLSSLDICSVVSAVPLLDKIKDRVSSLTHLTLFEQEELFKLLVRYKQTFV